MNAQEQFWAGEFGDAYTSRNRVNWVDRVSFWRPIINGRGIRNVFELGPNEGWNLRAIRAAAMHFVMTTGLEVNVNAAQAACKAGDAVYAGPAGDMTALFPAGFFDLTFTSGVLIHIAPADLERVMRDLVTLSSRFVLAVEYESPYEEMIEYRGHAERLWKRPYGSLYERMGLRLVERGEAQGFDRCHYWLMEKP